MKSFRAIAHPIMRTYIHPLNDMQCPDKQVEEELRCVAEKNERERRRSHMSVLLSSTLQCSNPSFRLTNEHQSPLAAPYLSALAIEKKS